ncbi:tetratricopeptide repeat protein [Kordiimonas sp.]|uniref:tetratricopeptide repeat protein n=1 Tax=Kordiimonas sp. TaxID=1970157 RepID=UPI003A91B99D
MLIVGYHVAKTGGTTVMHHIFNHLGEDVYFGYGNHPAQKLFFEGQPLWEELSAEERSQYRFVFGHHVNHRVLACLPDDNAALFTVLRDPYTHFVSQYKYHLSVIRGEGRTASAREYFETWRANSVSKELFKFFRRLHPEQQAEFSEEKLAHILRQFRFLCATEKLTEHSAPITRLMDIPPVEGRYRVSKNSADLEGLTPEDVYEKSPIDKRLHQMVLNGKGPDSGDGELAYDDALFKESMARLRADYDQPRHIQSAYKKLAGFFQHNDLIEAAQLYLAFRKKTDPKYAPIMRAAPLPDRMKLRLCVARSEREKAVVYASHNHPRLARACFEKAIQLNPNYVDAYVGLAHTLKRLDLMPQARDAVQHALSLDAGNEGAQAFVKAFLS